MTSQKAIQSLIADIDAVLNKAGSRLPWFGSAGDAAKQRLVLQRVRSYLVSQQQAPAPKAENLFQAGASKPETAQQILQVVFQEIDSLRASLIQPLQLEVEDLRQQRESLTKEIRQMESRRQHYHSLVQEQAKQQQIIGEFLQALTGRLQESLTEQMTQTLANLETQFLLSESLVEDKQGANLKLSPGISRPLHPRDRLEQLRQMQLQSDQMLVGLDSTLRIVFEALQRNLQGYEESLSQGLDKMHAMGQQGEVMFAALVNHLAQELGREASSYLQSSRQVAESASTGDTTIIQSSSESLPISIAPKSQVIQPEINSPTVDSQIPRSSTAERQMPFPGMELSSSESPVTNSNVNKNLSQEKWEIPDVDLDNLDGDDLDTIIQMDIDSLNAWRLFKEKQEAREKAAGTPPLPPIVIPPPPSKESNELDEFYQTLFGSESGSKSQQTDISEVKARSSQASAEIKDLGVSKAKPLALPAPTKSSSEVAVSDRSQESEQLSLGIEEALFAGMADPALPPSLEDRRQDASVTTVSESLEESLFYDQVSETAVADDLSDELKGVEIISALTDLLDEKALQSAQMPASEELLIVANNTRIRDNISADYHQQSDIVADSILSEDGYIPASPDESLLAIDESDEELDIDLLLDRKTLQKLSEDLSSFESPSGQDVTAEKQDIKPVFDAEMILLSDESTLESFSEIEELIAKETELGLDSPDELLAEDGDETVDSNTSVTSPELAAIPEDYWDSAPPTLPELAAIPEDYWESATIAPTVANKTAEEESDLLLNPFQLEELNWESEAALDQVWDETANGTISVTADELDAVLALFPPEPLSSELETAISEDTPEDIPDSLATGFSEQLNLDTDSEISSLEDAFMDWNLEDTNELNAAPDLARLADLNADSLPEDKNNNSNAGA